MADLGTYFVNIQPSAKGISTGIQAALGSPVDTAAKGAGMRMGGFMSSGMMTAVAAVGGAAAIGGLFKSGITAASDFEAGMNEVFTLLPGISGSAMSDMEGQVKQFSKQFGVLPKDTIPALYQSLSAGVPPGNVFDFMETAQKAAKGGVTDLTTAVDGISSVVNSYGADVISATETSDLMFTAVRLGKTTFEEMSASISNVAPVASALGIGFEDVTAGLATLTAQGVPTAQATTQMRAAFAELGKSGSVADKAFQQIAGKSFPQFIAEGGNVQQAFQMMSDGAEANGSSLIDMFGSIEAGQAVMALTKGDGEAFASSLAQMQSSAGATEAAFGQMNTGMKPAMDKLRANWSVAMVSMGEKLAPFITAVAERLPGAMSAAGGALKSVSGPASTFASALSKAFTFLNDNREIVIGAMVGIVAGLTAWGVSAAITAAANFTLAGSMIAVAAPFIAVGVAVAAFVAGLIWAYQNVGFFRQGVDSAVSWITSVAWPAIQVAFAAISSAISTAMQYATVAISTAVTWISTMWAQWGDTIMSVASFAFGYFSSQISNVFSYVTGVFNIFRGLFTGNWSLMWDGIKQTLSAAGSFIMTFLSTAWTIIRAVATAAWNALKAAAISAFNSIRDKITQAAQSARDRAVEAFNSLKSQAISAAQGLVSWMSGLPGRIISAIASIVPMLTAKGREMITGMKNGATGAAFELISFVGALPGRAAAALGGIGSRLYSAGMDLIQGMINGVRAMAGSIASAAADVVGGAISAAKRRLGVESPSKVFHEIGIFTGQGFVGGITKMANPVKAATEKMLHIPAKVEASMSKAAAKADPVRVAARPVARAADRTTAMQANWDTMDRMPAPTNDSLIKIETMNISDMQDVFTELNLAAKKMALRA